MDRESRNYYEYTIIVGDELVMCLDMTFTPTVQELPHAETYYYCGAEVSCGI
jgi:hypothetical protein